MKSERSNRKIAAILIAMILAISAFPLPMIAASEESNPDANFTEAINIQGESEEGNATENVTAGNQTNSVPNATDDTTMANESFEVKGAQVEKAVKVEATLSYPFFDDMENGTGNWTYDSPWNLTDEYAHSGSFSMTDSPDGLYGNNVDISATISSAIDLTYAQNPMLVFWERHLLASGDYGYVEVSIDSINWNREFYVRGEQTDWQEKQIDLAPYAREPQVWIRFRLVTDGSKYSDGWYIDDVSICEDTTTVSYPFFDDMEDSATTFNNWLNSSWGWVSPGHSGDRCWTDSPDGNYPHDIYTSLSLASMDLSGAVHPQLVFWHHGELHYRYDYDKACVQIGEYVSGDWTYTTIASYSDYNMPAEWTRVQLDLSSYAGSKIKVRFLLDDYPAYGEADGWYIDDVALKESPLDVLLYSPTNITRHTMDLRWAPSSDPDFDRYEVYRSTKTGVSLSDSLACVIYNPDSPCCTDTSLDMRMTYYYKVFVVKHGDVYSQGSNEVYATTQGVGYPFSDDMESGIDNWEIDSPWGLTTESCHSDSMSITDSPYTLYANNIDVSITTGIDLTNAQNPMLVFWERHLLESGDYGYVEISTDNEQTWNREFYVRGYQEEWQERQIDLAPYAREPQVRIRFRLVTDGSKYSDGWYIDDVSICEDTTTVSYPFFDDMEDGATTFNNWLNSSWGWVSPGHSGDRCWTDSPDGNYPHDIYTSLSLASMDLSGAVHPQLVFWHHGELHYRYDYDKACVQIGEYVSGDWTYTTIASYSDYNMPAEWTRVQLDLSSYAGSKIKVRFLLDDYPAYGEADGWYIDDVYIGEPPDVTPPASVTNLNETDVGSTWILWNWINPLDTDFNHTEVYINGTFKANVSAPEHSYRATELLPNTTYEIGTRTVDDSGNVNTTWVNDTAKTLPLEDKPTVSIFTDKYEYTASETMLINISLANPTEEWQNVKFLWRLDFPEYGLYFPIINNKSLWLPPGFDKTFTMPWTLPSWGLSFNASWYVALANISTYEIISEDTADWIYSFTTQDLGVKAANLSKQVVGAPYLWGGKGWNWNPAGGWNWEEGHFVKPENGYPSITGGYYYYSPTTGQVEFGKGLDCSGLSFWAFNKAAGTSEYPPGKPLDYECPVYYEGAHDQWTDEERLLQLPEDTPIDELKPGDLLFFDTDENGQMDHVIMYVGNGDVVHAEGVIYDKIVEEKLNTVLERYEDYFGGYGRVKTVPMEKMMPEEIANEIMKTAEEVELLI